MTLSLILDYVACGPVCGGFTQFLSTVPENQVACDNSRFWDSFAGKKVAPSVPQVIEFSSDDSDTTDSVSLLSIEVEAGKIPFSRIGLKEAMGRRLLPEHHHPNEPHDLHFDVVDDQQQVLQLGVLGLHPQGDPKDDEKDSLEVSSFDSRMGDTRFMEMEDDEEGGGDNEKRLMNDDLDDGSSYSSYYFRLRPKEPVEEYLAQAESRNSSVTHSKTSWLTTSTRTTCNVRNPSRFRKCD